jgi:hypothetical protein
MALEVSSCPIYVRLPEVSWVSEEAARNSLSSWKEV